MDEMMEKEERLSAKAAAEFAKLWFLSAPSSPRKEIFLSMLYQFTANQRDRCGPIGGAPVLYDRPCMKFILDGYKKGGRAAWNVLYVTLYDWYDGGRTFGLANVVEYEDHEAGTCEKEVLRSATISIEDMHVTAAVAGALAEAGYGDVKFCLPAGAAVREAWADRNLGKKELHAPHDMAAGGAFALLDPVRLPRGGQ